MKRYVVTEERLMAQPDHIQTTSVSTLTSEMAATDGSSAISETRRSNITLRDGGLCVLCGEDPVDVAHIVARKAAK